MANAAADLTAAIDRIDAETFARAVQDEALRRLDAFTAGVKLYQASSRAPRPPEPSVVWQSGSARLLDYGTSGGRPILVVPSLVNRGYVLDLSEERSLLRDLADRGFHPFLMDWGAPDADERSYSLTDYITGPLQDAFDHVAGIGSDAPALIGYCMGGNLAVALAARNAGRVGALALLATPWDFQAGQEAYLPVLGAMAPALDAVIENLGVLPTDLLQAMFAGLNPQGVGMKFRQFSALPDNSAKAREFIALEDWLNDGVPLAGPVARECLFDWYLNNSPVQGAWRVAGEVVDPGALDVPTLVVVPNDDYIVPPGSAKPLARLIPGARLKTVNAGHIGMVAGRRARSVLYTPLANWLTERLI